MVYAAVTQSSPTSASTQRASTTSCSKIGGSNCWKIMIIEKWTCKENLIKMSTIMQGISVLIVKYAVLAVERVWNNHFLQNYHKTFINSVSWVVIYERNIKQIIRKHTASNPMKGIPLRLCQLHVCIMTNICSHMLKNMKVKEHIYALMQTCCWSWVLLVSQTWIFCDKIPTHLHNCYYKNEIHFLVIYTMGLNIIFVRTLFILSAPVLSS